MPKDRSVPSRFAMCRVWQHAWEYTTVERKGHDLVQGLRCLRCKAEKFVKIGARSGERHGSSMKYPEGYLMPEGGPLTAKERAALRLNEIRSRLEE